MAKVKRQAGRGRKTVVDRDSLRNAIRSSPSSGFPQAVAIHDSLSTIACTSIDIFAIVYALLDRVDGCARHRDKICDLTHFGSCTKKCRNFHSIISLQSQFEIRNNNNLFLRCQSHRTSGGLNKSQIITAKQPEL